MTVALDQAWQGSCQAHPASHKLQRTKPLLRISPTCTTNNIHHPSQGNLSPTLPLQSPGHLTPASPQSGSSSTSSSFKHRMHFRVRSISGAKLTLSASQKFDALSDKDKGASHLFVKDAVSMCGLAGFSWKKTYEYLQLAADLPLPPDYILNPEDSPVSDSLPTSANSSRRPSISKLLAPESASTLVSQNPSQSSISTLGSSGTAVASSSWSSQELKPILTRIRLLFESMQKWRDPVYLHYIHLPANNLKEQHKLATAKHRDATLRVERSSLMDAIEFDKRADRSRDMEVAVAKLRFEMELEMHGMAERRQRESWKKLEDVGSSSREVSPTPTRSDSGIIGPEDSVSRSGTMRSIMGSGSGSGPGLDSMTSSSSRRTPRILSRTDSSDMRREASANNRISGVPTIITTVSDVHIQMQQSNAAGDDDIGRPDSPAPSAKSEGRVHVQSRNTWRKLQDAKARMSGTRSRNRIITTDGVSTPGSAQRVEGLASFGRRES